MLDKSAVSFIIVTAASAVLFACSSDSNSSGPAPESTIDTPQSSDSDDSTIVTPMSSNSDDSTIVTPTSSDSETSVSTSSSWIATSSSSSRNDEQVECREHLLTDAHDRDAESCATRNDDLSPYLWNDEFNTLDSTKWTFETGTGASGWGNNEWQYYTGRPENAYVQDGILHIRANKEDFEGAKYTSARMITKGKFSFTYGTVEARIALPTGKGIWPAFWTLGENIDAVSWPACGEIDIIEAVNSENIVYGTNHWQTEGNQADYGNNTSDFHGAKKELDITQFHTYKMVWNSEVIAMYVDDFKYHEISIKENAGGTDAFHKPQFFLLNVAVAGNWPGFEVDDTQFPNEMLVDYIRISQ